MRPLFRAVPIKTFASASWNTLEGVECSLEVHVFPADRCDHNGFIFVRLGCRPDKLLCRSVFENDGMVRDGTGDIGRPLSSRGQLARFPAKACSGLDKQSTDQERLTFLLVMHPCRHPHGTKPRTASALSSAGAVLVGTASGQCGG
jgi:hypothetical protein